MGMNVRWLCTGVVVEIDLRFETLNLISDLSKVCLLLRSFIRGTHEK